MSYCFSDWLGNDSTYVMTLINLLYSQVPDPGLLYVIIDQHSPCHRLRQDTTSPDDARDQLLAVRSAVHMPKWYSTVTVAGARFSRRLSCHEKFLFSYPNDELSELQKNK